MTQGSPACPFLSQDLLVDDEGWEDLNDADVPVAAQSVLPGDAAPEEDVDVDDLSVVQRPVGLPEPKQPSQREINNHYLTHAKYKAWCPRRVSGRRPNAQHRSQSGDRRKVPMSCADNLLCAR